MRFLASLKLWLTLIATSVSASAGEADVIDVRAVAEINGTWRFEVTVAHADEGWEHYADRWEVVAPNGDVLATRTLLHPHVEEQPFTRHLSGVSVPPGVDWVVLRAHDSLHGYGGREKRVSLTVP